MSVARLCVFFIGSGKHEYAKIQLLQESFVGSYSVFLSAFTKGLEEIEMDSKKRNNVYYRIVMRTCENHAVIVLKYFCNGSLMYVILCTLYSQRSLALSCE